MRRILDPVTCFFLFYGGPGCLARRSISYPRRELRPSRGLCGVASPLIIGPIFSTDEVALWVLFFFAYVLVSFWEGSLILVLFTFLLIINLIVFKENVFTLLTNGFCHCRVLFYYLPPSFQDSSCSFSSDLKNLSLVWQLIYFSWRVYCKGNNFPRIHCPKIISKWLTE